MTYPVTPNPSIHSVAASNSGGAVPTSPFASPIIQAWASKLLESIVGQVVNALTLGLIPANSPALAALFNFGSTASTAATNASTALTHFTDLINGVVGGSGNPLSALIASLSGTATTATTANSITNPAVSALNGRVAALESAGAGLTSIHYPFSGTTLTGWTTVSPLATPTIVTASPNNYVQNSAEAAAYYSAATCSTDKIHVQAVVSNSQHGKSRLWIGNAAMSNYASVEVETGFVNNNIRIQRGTTPTTVTQEGVVAHGVSNGDVIALEYFPASNTYFAFYNSMQVLSWTDTTNLVSHGVGNRQVGLLLDGDASFANPGIGWGSFTAYDIP